MTFKVQLSVSKDNKVNQVLIFIFQIVMNNQVLHAKKLNPDVFHVNIVIRPHHILLKKTQRDLSSFHIFTSLTLTKSMHHF